MEKGIKNKVNLINDVSGLEYDVKKSIGMEYSKERHKGAIYLSFNWF